MNRILLLTVLLLAVLPAACGKKGDVLPPPGYENPERPRP